MIDVNKLMKALAQDRPMFHSEADFQQALGWQIHRAIPEEGVRLEYKPRPKLAMYVDLWLARNRVAVELKYRTRVLDCNVAGERYVLRDQKAQPPSRYSFVKDVQRLEEFAREAREVRSGLAVFLTNDAGYWKEPSRRSVVDEEFRIHEGGQLAGVMKWSDGASLGTRKGREEAIRLEGKYGMVWRDYASVGAGRHETFRYLAIQVGNGN